MQNKFRLTVLSSFIAASLFSTNALSAQQTLEEIIVTSQKREQSLQDVGVSVTAFSGETLDNLGLVDTISISAQTPGLSLNMFHPSIARVNIRGVSQNDFADHLEGPVALYSDEVYLSAMGVVHGLMFDTERVEVLRGPQGTLFGRNATGGLIHYISRAPSEETEGFAQVKVGEYNQIGLQGAVSGGLTDNLNGRFSLSSNKHDGFIENTNGEDIRDADDYALRGQLAYALSDVTDIWLKLSYSESDTTGATWVSSPAAPDAEGLGTITAQDSDPFKNAYTEPGLFEKEYWSATVRVTHEFESGNSLTSITNYQELEKDFDEDVDGTVPEFFNLITGHEMDQFSQELRLDGSTDYFKWVTGLYYLTIDTDNTKIVEFFPISGVQTDNTADYTVDVESWAAFFQGEVELTDQLALTMGVRYTEDDKEIDYFLVNETFLMGGTVAFNSDITSLAEQSYENISAKLQLDWRPNNNTLIYAGYNRGHKGGNFVTPEFLPPISFDQLPHEEEVLTSYEAGFKVDLLDQTLRINGAVFLYDYKDYQAFFLKDFVLQIRNRDAEIKGAELEVTWVPNENWFVQLGAATADGEVEDIPLAISIVDREMPQTPDLTLNGLIAYTFSAFSGEVSLQLDFDYSSEFFWDVLNAPVHEEPSRIVSNGSISYTTDDGAWDVSFWVKNLGQKTYRNAAFDLGSFGFATEAYAPPRWLGATVTYNW